MNIPFERSDPVRKILFHFALEMFSIFVCFLCKKSCFHLNLAEYWMAANSGRTRSAFSCFKQSNLSCNTSSSVLRADSAKAGELNVVSPLCLSGR